ncbi:MAG: von Willebrand factor type A domain-containing protein [Acidobacteriota bacterium]
MNTDPKNLARRLSEPEETPEPPKDLADRIRADIPDVLPRPALPNAGEDSGAPRWRIAAVLVAAVLAGSLTWWVSQEVPMAPESVSEQEAAAAGTRAKTEAATEMVDEPSQIAPEAVQPIQEGEVQRGREEAALPADSEAARQPAPDPTPDPVPTPGAPPEVSAEVGEQRAERMGRLEELKRRARQPSQRDAEGAASEPGSAPRDQPARGDSQDLPEADFSFADAPTPPPVHREPRREVPPPPSSPASVAPPGRAQPAPQENASIALEDRAYRSLEKERRQLETELRALEEGRSDRKRRLAEPELARAQPVEPRVAPAPSTGGTAEPNGHPHGDMFFQHSGVNPFLDPAEDARSTFSLDVDRASFTLLRSYLDQGYRPPRDAVRVEEIVNALDAAGDPPTDRALHWSVEAAPTPFTQGPDYRLVRFHMASRPVVDRPAAALTLLVDVSGSMAQGGRIELVRRSFRLLLDRLQPGDRVALVTFGRRAQVVLEPTADLDRVRAALARLSPSGSTHAAAGLEAAYDLALRHLRPGAINRVILASDGVANTGETDGEALLERLAAGVEAGIELTALGFGMGNYNDILLEKLADDGDGNYAYIDTLDEAEEVLGTQLGATLLTVAEDARVQVEFEPALVDRYRLLGYENRDLPDRDFRNTASDGGEIGAGHRVTALYEIKLRPEAFESTDAFAALRFRYRDPSSREWIEQELPLTARDLAPSWRAASPEFRQAALAAELAEILRGSYWARESSLAEVARRAHALATERPGNAQAAELARLTARAAGL